MNVAQPQNSKMTGAVSSLIKPEGGLRSAGKRINSHSHELLISVITVVYNGAATLEDTIKSVICQRYSNVEYIVIDGGSTDGTVDIIKKYEDSIDYWLSEKDQGIYDAMNKGIALASGDYVGLLNSDDMFADDDVLQNLAGYIRSTGADAIFSCLNIVDQHDIKKVLRKCRVAKFSSGLLRIGVMPPHPTFYCKKICYERAGIYRTDYKIAADFEMLVRLLVRQKITWEFMDKVTVVMRSGGLSNSGIGSRIKLNREIVRACVENGLYTNFFLLVLKLPIRLYELIR